MDQLAAEGMRFTNFYASGPVCSPTRAGLLTGRYQQRAGIPGVVYAAPDRNRHHGLQHSETTFAEVLRDAGYATGMFGKWHLGYQRQYNPIQHGFDEFRGYVSGNIDFFSHVDQAGFYDWWSQDQLVNEPGYVTHLINEHAVNFIKKNKDRPFVLYLPHEAPHYPYQGPNDQGFRIVHTPQSQATTDTAAVKKAYREMVEEMDRGIGAILSTLDNLGLNENTLILFFSDNGAARQGSNGKLRGTKGTLWEGGIRVPAIARWKGSIEPNSITHQHAITIDVMPTILSMAGLASPKRLDGKDLSQTLFTSTRPFARTLYWSYNLSTAIREGDWKLINRTGDAPLTQLFNLKDTDYEGSDLAKQFPERTNMLQNKLSAWKTDVLTGATKQPDKPVEE